jgi:Tol biopolymer transport system component
VVSSRSGHFQLYATERANLAQLRKITSDTATALDPAFSPDGSRIAFASRRAIYVMDADGTNTARVTNSTGTDAHPVFTPDGNAIVFDSDRSGHSQIFVQPLTGTDAVQLTQEPGVNTEPAVSPDGETIAFVSTRDGGTNVWLMGKDGSNQRPFTKNANRNYRSTEPLFLRDGSLWYLVEVKEGGHALTQVVKGDLPSGRVTPVTGTDLVLADFSASPSGDLLALVVNVQAGGKPVYKVYIQPSGTGGAAVPLPTTGTEQMVTPAFMP